MKPPTCLSDLTHHFDKPAAWRISLVQPEIGGGQLDSSSLSKLEEHPNATAITVSGLDQEAFEALISKYGGQFTGMHFWKCPRIADFSPLEDLPALAYVAFYWNQRASRLWNFTRTPNLRGLEFDDFRKLHDLSDLGAARSLEELHFGNKVWSTCVFNSLEPLEPLQGLRTLSFDAKRIDDGKIQPLAALRGLRSLDFPPNQFTTRQVAWLRAHLPESVRGRALVPTVTFGKGIDYDGKNRDVLLVGKRKPFLNSALDAKRIERHVSEFRKMVDEFAHNPELQPD